MLTADSPAVRDFVAAYEANQNIAGHPIKVIAEDRRKYIVVDEVDADATPPYRYPHIAHRGGRFMIDRETGAVHSIRGYGKAHYRVGDVAELTQRYREGTESFGDRPSRVHVEHGHAKVASAPPRRFAVIQGGRSRRRGGLLRAASRHRRRAGVR